MRWRMYIVFFAATAAFCFMLLTAVTDYGSTHYHPVLTSARGSGATPLSAVATTERQGEADAVSRAVTGVRFDPMLRPETPRLFVPRNADPVRERLDREQAIREVRGKLPPQKRLRLDDRGWHRVENALVTAYCPCSRCCGSDSLGITSIGKNAWKRGLAADPTYLRYGTEVFIPGYGLSVIDDTGGAMRRNWRRGGRLHIDVRMTYHHEARKWGKKQLAVKIYEND